ncbi:MAG: hypothetical protein V1766_04485 [Pseudomonadota bacterium]
MDCRSRDNEGKATPYAVRFDGWFEPLVARKPSRLISPPFVPPQAARTAALATHAPRETLYQGITFAAAQKGGR